MLAAENGHTEVVLALIVNNAGVNAKNLVRLRYYVSTGEGARECIEEWNGDFCSFQIRLTICSDSAEIE